MVTKMTNLPLEGMVMRKANDKALTKVVGDENPYGCVRLCGQ